MKGKTKLILRLLNSSKYAKQEPKGVNRLFVLSFEDNVHKISYK